MDFETQKVYFNNLPYSASDDVFAASFASYVTQVRDHYPAFAAVELTSLPDGRK